MKNKQVAKAFKLVRDSLIKRKSWNWNWICFELEDLYDIGLITKKTLDAAKNIIESRLENNSSYQSWVREKHPDVYKSALDSWQFLDLMHYGRIQWLESLIEEFSE